MIRPVLYTAAVVSLAALAATTSGCGGGGGGSSVQLAPVAGPSQGAAPAVTSFTPAAGAAGTFVTITGSNLLGASAVLFDGTSAAFTVNGPTQITAAVPAGASDGTITVTTRAGSATSTSPFTPTPTISGFTPLAGGIGTTVTISGANLATVRSLSFGGAQASFTIVSANTITAVVPPGATLGVITVSSTGGTGSSSAAFTPAGASVPQVGTPAITGIAPASAGVGVMVTISGTNLANASAVTFGGGPGATILSSTASSIAAIVPAGSASGSVSVTTAGGTASFAGFTLVPAPSIASFTPSSAGAASTVTITGTNLSNALGVSFGSGPSATITANTATSIQAVVPFGATSGSVSVNTAGGTASASGFTLIPPPTVTSMVPSSQVTGGAITLGGTNLANASAVTFSGGVTGTIQADSATQVTVLVPAGAGAGAIAVTTPGGTASSTVSFTPAPAPVVTGVSPSVGSLAGGTTVTLTGSNFTNASGVSFGGTAATGVTIFSSSQITATAPAGAAGTVDVTVTTPQGTSVTATADRYTYQGAPAVTAVSPPSGPIAGGGSVTIAGTNLSGATTVAFGSRFAPSFTVVSPSRITATVPLGTAGSVDVTVTTPVGTSATGPSDVYTFQNPPIVSSVSPVAGPTAGGATVTITGSNFTGASAVSFGSFAAPSFTVNAAGTQITATSPSNVATTVDVTVTTASGTSAAGAADQYTYQGGPTVTGVSPAAGPTGGGATVTITGTGFTGATSVMFGSNAASFTVSSATQISATVPAGSAGAVDVIVATPAGTSGAATSDRYTYASGPAVTGVSPAAGAPAGGNSVTITGTGFTGVTAVKFGSNPASSFSVSGGQIQAVVPAGSGAVDVTVTAVGGTSPTIPADQYTYETAPTITSVSPAAGPTSGANTVTITGTNFTGATSVVFGATAATSFNVISATQITATAPSAAAGTVHVTVATPSGANGTTGANVYSFEPAPTVTGVSPTSGAFGGGTAVTVTGTNFTGATAVNFGSNPGTSLNVISATQLTVVAPSGTGTVDVTVTSPSGSSAPVTADHFSYANAPAVTGVSPKQGPLAGGTTVTITGTAFTGALSVKFGATNATSFAVNSDTQITAVAPAGTDGKVDVLVTTASGTSSTSSSDNYFYEAAPTVTSLSPSGGPLAGGTSVTINGTDFIGATAVKFGSTLATSFSVVSATQITAAAPAGSLGSVHVAVTNPLGTSITSSADLYSYTTGPAVSNVAPVAGVPGGGTSVTIKGSGFTGATAVRFGSTPATSFSIGSDLVITATAPAGAGTVDITVTTPAGTSATSPADQYLYESAPTVTSVSPTAGAPAGGTTVTITGSNFLDATAVQFGTVAAASFTINSSSQITATTPAGTGTVDITVTTPVGTSATSSNDQLTFEGAPTVSGVSPALGPIAGGTTVTITGTGFTNASIVNFGSSAASSFTVVSSVQITATTPAEAAGAVDVKVTTPLGTNAATTSDKYTFAGIPTVTAVSPTQGTTSGGTTVTITGTNLAAASSVRFGTTPATSFSVKSATQITAVTPAASAGTVDITVTTPGGTSATSASDQYAFAALPTVASLSPTSGGPGGGTSVTITGTSFTGATAVKFGSTAATSFTVNSPTQITATSPAESPATVDVTVTTPAGTSAIVAPNDQFAYVGPPSISTISPSSGSSAGGTTVSISGSNFGGVTAVMFGSTAATSFTVTGTSLVKAVAPAGTGTVDITVQATGGTSATSSADQYTFTSPPQITSVTPSQGPTSGGTSVTINGKYFNGAGGSNFTGTNSVKFGSTQAVFTIVSDTQITVTSPGASAAGPVDIVVTTLGGGSSQTSTNDQFTYTPPPQVTGVSPTVGPTSGSTAVTITGSKFTGATAVFFGPKPGFIFSASDTQIVAISPAETPGTVDITVTATAGTSQVTPADQFTYEGPPTVTGVSPNAGALGGGNSVTITGTNFLGTTNVSFGITSASSFTVNSVTQITAVAPAEVAGTVDVTVKTPSGTSAASASDQYSYDPPPTVTNISATSGPTTGGTSVTITGTNFVSGATTVAFGATPASSVTFVSATQVTAVSPPESNGVVDIRVTTPGGTSARTIKDEFTVGAPPPPTLTSFSPASAPAGATITINGTNFIGATSVTFNGGASAVPTVVSGTEVTVVVPATATSGALTVTAPGGTSPASSTSFTVLTSPLVTLVSAVGGPTVGGCVTINYTVSQAQSQPVDIVVEYDLSGGGFSGPGPFPRCTQGGSAPGAGPLGVSGVPTSAAGTAHTFEWSSTADFPNRTTSANVAVRVRALLDGQSGTTSGTVTGLTIANGVGLVAASGSPVLLGASGNPQLMAVGDLNGDGIADFVVTDQATGSVAVFLGQGGGKFAAATPPTLVVGLSPQGVALGDLNGDGKLDLVVANSGASPGTISVFLGKGDGTFQTGTAVGVGTRPVFVAMADVNGDGNQDVVVANQGDNTISVLLGNGKGAFVNATGSPFFNGVGSGPTGIAVGDLNGDGKPDLVVTNSNDGTVSSLLGKGNGTFSPVAGNPFAVGRSPRFVAMGDLNGDGNLDVAVANNADNTVTVLLGTGKGTFSAAAGSPLGVGKGPVSVAMGDVDASGSLDLVVTNETDGTVSVLLGNGAGTFTPGGTTAVGSLPIGAALADVDGNGNPDVLVVNSKAPGSISVLLNTQPSRCDARFYAAQALFGGQNPQSVAVGDLNGDGKPDVVVANHGSNDVSVYLGHGDDTYTLNGTLTTGAANARFVAVGDVNGDGKLDVVVVNDTSNSVTVFLGKGDGTFQVGVSTATGNGPTSVAIGDVNGDGKPDLVVTNFADATVSILVGNSSASFVPSGTSATGAGPTSVVIADLNLDGKPDLAVANQTGNSVTVLIGNGSGGFSPATGSPITAGIGSAPSAIAAGDVNGDGILDLALANTGSNNVSVLLGNGDGTFAAAIGNPFAVDVSGSPGALALGDVNGDGFLDIATANGGTDTVSVLAGNGTGHFSAMPSVAAGKTPYAVALAPTSGSANLDLIVADNGTGASPGARVSVIRGHGDGTFDAAPTTAAGNTPSFAASADLNGDGKPDVVIANGADGTVSVFLGKGDGTFSPASVATLNVGSGPVCLLLADLNRDGKPDLVVANQKDNDLSIFLGNGDGTFRNVSGSPFPLGASPSFVATADLRGSGKLDLLVASQAGNAVIVLLGVGDGTFNAAPASPIVLGPGSAPAALVVGDFDRDGKIDVATANFGTNNVSVYHGVGDGTFTHVGDTAVGTGPVALAAADVNGDGKLDLAVLNKTAATVTVLLGDGAGGFPTTASTPATGKAPVGVAIADMDGDGTPDLLVVSSGSDCVQVYAGKGDGTFTLASSPGTGFLPAGGIAVGDLNGDGKPDVVVPNGGGASFSVLLGN